MIYRSPLIGFFAGLLLGFSVVRYADAIAPWVLPDPPLPPLVAPTLALPPPTEQVNAQMVDLAP